MKSFNQQPRGKPARYELTKIYINQCKHRGSKPTGGIKFSNIINKNRTMILIADGGSTKTDWRLLDGEVIHAFHTKGINPFHNDEDQIIEEINKSDIIKMRSNVTEIYFYGAGLVNENVKNILKNIFVKLFPLAGEISVNDDLLAAARALFDNDKGIACILGTGSNSCLFNGVSVEDKVPALGYILGDEGSGAKLGIKLVNTLYKRGFSENLSNQLMQESDLEMTVVLENVYKKHLPNLYLASLTKIIKKHIDNTEVYNLVKELFVEFIDKNISKYNGFENYAIGFVGSIAYHFNDILSQVLKEKGLKLGKIVQAPIDELIAYHRNILIDKNN